MIKISLITEKNKLKTISITGHACYDDYGKDIVCASVSSIVITTINAILKINKDAITYKEGKVLEISILSYDDVTSKLISNMIDMLKELEGNYSKNIKIYRRDNL